MSLLTPDQVEENFSKLPLEWTLLAGGVLLLLKETTDFKQAMVYVNKVAALAEAADHHPDIAISYDKVEIRITTHSAGGLTSKDFNLAEQIVKIG